MGVLYKHSLGESLYEEGVIYFQFVEEKIQGQKSTVRKSLGEELGKTEFTLWITLYFLTMSEMPLDHGAGQY